MIRNLSLRVPVVATAAAPRMMMMAPSSSSSQLLASQRFCSAASTSESKGKKKETGFFTTEKKEKMVTGALAAGITASTTLGVCHLLVAPVNSGILAGSVLGGGLTGACAAFEGSESGGAGFGVLIGLFIGGMGAYYAKNSEAPWSAGGGNKGGKK